MAQPAFEIPAVSRCGVFDDYAARFAELLNQGIRLINSPEEQRRASELTEWYPRLEGLTPRSHVFASPPTATEISREFGFPVFVKGIRQTSRHRKSLSIIETPDAWERAMEGYAADPILRWQPLVVREFIALRRVEDPSPERILSSFEFRTFWWKGHGVGAGRYWWEGKAHEWTPHERESGMRLAQEAAERVGTPFLVVDLAMTAAGEWIVIECNDGQESGYAGVSPFRLWQRIIDVQQNGIGL